MTSFSNPTPRTVKEYFIKSGWRFPLCFDLPSTLSESKKCGIGTIIDHNELLKIKKSSLIINEQIKLFFKSELKADSNTVNAFRISDPILCQLDSNENIQLFVTQTEYFQSNKLVKDIKDDIFTSLYKSEDDYIYSISKAAIFNIKGDSIIFFDWWR